VKHSGEVFADGLTHFVPGFLPASRLSGSGVHDEINNLSALSPLRIKTAKALGLSVPLVLQQRADEVIE
jgi:hypothetical protein